MKKYTLLFLALLACEFVLALSNPSLKFIENKNQWQKSIYYRAKVHGGYFSLMETGFDFHFYDYQKINRLHTEYQHQVSDNGEVTCTNEGIDARFVSVSFLGSKTPVVRSTGKSATYYNYFLNSNPAMWGTKAHAYDEIIYENFYEGISMRVYSEGPNAKYDWIVQPEVDVQQIQWQYNGVDSLYLNHGSIYATTNLADIIENKPTAYQVINGVRYKVQVSFTLTNNTLSYQFKNGYDPCYELVIDPLLIFSTYSGATADNWGSSATPGERGTLFSTGVVLDVYSAGGQIRTGQLSETTSSFQVDNAGGFDIAVFKYDSTGTQLLWATYLGGSANESPHSLLMNNSEELLVLGTTSSANFPVSTNAFSKNFTGGDPTRTSSISFDNGSDIIVARISNDGTELLSSTFIGGTANDGLNARIGPLTKNYGDDQRGDILVDDSDNVYITTITSSADFPVANSFDMSYNGGTTDGIIMKLNKELSTITWASYIGGSGTDAAHTLKFDVNKNLLVGGGTTSTNFPNTTGTYQQTKNSDADGWMARVATNGSAILTATFTGTNGFDQVYFIDADSDGNIYVYGQTDGDFPITAGVYNNPNSGQFVQKFNADLSVLQFSTVFGSGIGIPNISPTAFLVNDCNNIYLTGWGGRVNSQQGYWGSTTASMPVTNDALQKTTRGSDFYFMVLTNDATQLLYATYLGGTQAAIHVDGGTSRFDKGGVVYHAVCAGCGGFDDFPTTTTAWSRLNNSLNCNNAAFKFDLSSLKARLQTNNLQRTLPGLSVICIPDPIVFQNFSIGGETFEWNFGDGTTVVRTDTVSFPYRYESEGIYNVTLTIIDQGTCKVRDVATKQIQVNFAESTVQNDDALCEGDEYRLQAQGGQSYSWQNNITTSILTGSAPFVQPNITTQYIVTITEASGCIRKDTVILSVIPAIVPEFSFVRESACEVRPFVSVQNTQADSINYVFLFDFGDGSQTDLPRADHIYATDSTYSVRLIAQRDFCVFEEEVTIDVFSLLIPNVITPAIKDGKNDTFFVQYGKPGKSPADRGLTVNLLLYNRWGKQVYKNNNYKNDWSAENIEAGIYYYEVTVQGHATCKDWLHVIK
jgi:CHU_C Type IX secretion signal domain/PKD domain